MLRPYENAYLNSPNNEYDAAGYLDAMPPPPVREQHSHQKSQEHRHVERMGDRTRVIIQNTDMGQSPQLNDHSHRHLQNFTQEERRYHGRSVVLNNQFESMERPVDYLSSGSESNDSLEIDLGLGNQQGKGEEVSEVKDLKSSSRNQTKNQPSDKNRYLSAPFQEKTCRILKSHFAGDLRNQGQILAELFISSVPKTGQIPLCEWMSVWLQKWSDLKRWSSFSHLETKNPNFSSFVVLSFPLLTPVSERANS